MVTDHILEYQHNAENDGIVCSSIATEDYKHLLATFCSGVSLFLIIISRDF